MKTCATVVYEQSSLVVLARVKRVGSNSYLTIASTSSISVSTYNSTTAALVTTVTPTVSAVVFDTLQTDDRWNVEGDTTGYNLAIPLTAAHFPDGNTNYQIEVLITPTDGYEIRFSVPVRTRDLLSV